MLIREVDLALRTLGLEGRRILVAVSGGIDSTIVACIAVDGKVTPAEAELVRSVAVSLDCAIPPIAVGELSAQKQRLDTYTIQARFALASIYDIAATVSEVSE